MVVLVWGFVRSLLFLARLCWGGGGGSVAIVLIGYILQILILVVDSSERSGFTESGRVQHIVKSTEGSAWSVPVTVVDAQGRWEMLGSPDESGKEC